MKVYPIPLTSKSIAYGITFQELFRNALKGMFASCKPQGPAIAYKDDEPLVTHFNVEHEVVTHSSDRESLLIDFLSDCLYLSDVNNEAYFDARFSLFDETELKATHFWGPY